MTAAGQLQSLPVKAFQFPEAQKQLITANIKRCRSFVAHLPIIGSRAKLICSSLIRLVDEEEARFALSCRMLRLVLAASPIGLYLSQRRVESRPPASGYSDRYVICFTPEETQKVRRALRVSKREPSQLAASAFFRSPAFSLERVLLGVLFFEYQSNHELLHRDWNKGQTVSSKFAVVKRTPHMTRHFSEPYFITELSLSENEIGISSRILEKAPISKEGPVWAVASYFHSAYSRVLLAGAKWKLFGDIDTVILKSSQ